MRGPDDQTHDLFQLSSPESGVRPDHPCGWCGGSPSRPFRPSWPTRPTGFFITLLNTGTPRPNVHGHGTVYFEGAGGQLAGVKSYNLEFRT
jgi:hypothetical protein